MQLPQFSMPVFPHIDVSSFINTPTLLIILVLFFIAYAIVSGILMYHWSAYGMKSQGVLIAETLFLFVSVILFVIASLGLYYF